MTAPALASAATRPCALYLDHGSAVPSVTQAHHVFPVYLQHRLWGEVRDRTLLHLCGTCHDNVHAWLYWITGERAHPLPTPPARARLLAVKARDLYLTAAA